MTDAVIEARILGVLRAFGSEVTLSEILNFITLAHLKAEVQGNLDALAEAGVIAVRDGPRRYQGRLVRYYRIAGP